VAHLSNQITFPTYCNSGAVWLALSFRTGGGGPGQHGAADGGTGRGAEPHPQVRAPGRRVARPAAGVLNSKASMNNETIGHRAQNRIRKCERQVGASLEQLQVSAK